MYKFLWGYVFRCPGDKPRSEVAGSYCNYISSFDFCGMFQGSKSTASDSPKLKKKKKILQSSTTHMVRIHSSSPCPLGHLAFLLFSRCPCQVPSWKCCFCPQRQSLDSLLPHTLCWWKSATPRGYPPNPCPDFHLHPGPGQPLATGHLYMAVHRPPKSTAAK